MLTWLIYLYLFSVVLQQQGNGDIEVITTENSSRITELNQYQNNSSFVSDIEFSPLGNLLCIIEVMNELSIVHDGSVRVLETSTLKQSFAMEQTYQGQSIAFSSDQRQLVVGNQQGEISIIDLNTHDIIFNAMIDDAEISDVAIDPTGTWLAASIGNFTTVRENLYAFTLIEISTGARVQAVQVTESPSLYGANGSSVLFPNSETIVFSTGEGLIRYWEIPSGREVDTTEGFGYGYLVYQAESQLLAYIDNDNAVQVVHLTDEGFQQRQTVSASVEDAGVWRVAFHPEQPIIAIAYIYRPDVTQPTEREGIIQLWNLETRRELVRKVAHPDIITALAFSPDGTLLASGGADGTLRLWGIPAGE
jgi:WD40 repeat protein